MDSIGGIFVGFILFGLAFWPAWCSVKGVQEISKQIEALPLQTAADVAGGSGLVKIHGEPEGIDAVNLEIDDENEDYYEEFDVLWYHQKLQEYKTHPETRTETVIENGQEVEKTIEEQVEDWETESEETETADFSLGDVEIRPGGSDIIITDYETYDSKGRERIGEQWLTVDYVPVDQVREMLVVGDLINDAISSGKPFIVTDLSDAELIARKATGEAGQRTGATILAIVMFFLAFNLLIGPLMFMLKFIPVLGPAIRFGIGIGSLILAVVLVFLLKFIIMFWWLILVLLAVLVVLLVVVASRKKHEPAPAAAAVEPETHTESDVSPPQG
jgi:hypothetical protein